GEGGGEEASTGDFDAEGFARDNCASCHGEDFSGSMGPALAGTSLDEGEFTEVVRNGRGSMPSFSQDQIADEDLTALYEFMADQELIRKLPHSVWKFLLFVAKAYRRHKGEVLHNEIFEAADAVYCCDNPFMDAADSRHDPAMAVRGDGCNSDLPAADQT